MWLDYETENQTVLFAIIYLLTLFVDCSFQIIEARPFEIFINNDILAYFFILLHLG